MAKEVSFNSSYISSALPCSSEVRWGLGFLRFPCLLLGLLSSSSFLPLVLRGNSEVVEVCTSAWGKNGRCVTADFSIRFFRLPTVSQLQKAIEGSWMKFESRLAALETTVA